MENNQSAMWNMHRAAAGGQVDRIRELHEQGADVNHCGIAGNSLVWFAAYKGHVECIRVQHELGADVNICTTVRISPADTSPVWIAAHKGCVDSIRVLLALGADVNKCRSDGTSPITLAAQANNSACVLVCI
jgi:ankyrin repeat protein